VENQQEYWLMCRISSWTHLLRRTFVNTSSQTPTTTQSLVSATTFALVLGSNQTHLGFTSLFSPCMYA
jgi:hypothetical protein